MEYGYKEHGGIGTDKIKESVKRRRNPILGVLKKMSPRLKKVALEQIKALPSVY